MEGGWEIREFLNLVNKTFCFFQSFSEVFFKSSSEVLRILVFQVFETHRILKRKTITTFFDA